MDKLVTALIENSNFFTLVDEIEGISKRMHTLVVLRILTREEADEAMTRVAVHFRGLYDLPPLTMHEWIN